MPNPRSNLNFVVSLKDSAKNETFVEAEKLYVLPPSYQREKDGKPVPFKWMVDTATFKVMEPHKSHLKTFRFPLEAFTKDGRKLDLKNIVEIRFVFDKPRDGFDQGTIGLDDIAFEK